MTHNKEQALQLIRDRLRSGQRQMADWQTGPLAVSAVPGAGKSTGMAGAAAIAIARNQLHSRRQLVVVTFTRSAAANIKAKIRRYLREDLSLPQIGFVVQTLHGLALNIASRHPQLSGLNLNNVTVVTPDRSHRLIRAAVERWIAANPRRYQILVAGQQFDGEETERLRRQSVLRTEVLPSLAQTVIHEAKSSGYLPAKLWELSEQTRDDYGILAIAAGLYENYQDLLRSRDFIDYDEMILAALRVLENENIRRLWQNQVFAVFEDEAQDSSPLQTKLLEILATDPSNPNAPPNLVRVGDPNQAINSTFTPADPIYFRRFCSDCESNRLLATMDRAGRSSQIIIDAANFVLEWVNTSQLAGTEQPFRPQKILPVTADDPQPDANPDPVGRGLEIYTPRDVHHSVKLIGERVLELFAQYPTEKRSAAVLVRTNDQGRFVHQQLKEEYGDRIDIYDVVQHTLYTKVPAEILSLLQFVDRPHSPDYLKAALEVLVQRQLIPPQDLNALASLPEQFLYPGPLDPPQTEQVLKARRFCTKLLRARIELPHYQLITFLALALNYDPTELATADKLAERVVRQTAGDNSMPSTLNALSEIVSSERFEPVDTEGNDSQYTQPGKLTIVTMHKAKGLDWDYVFIPFLHAAMIPGNLRIPTPTQFLGDFTLAEVARAQIRASLHGESALPEVTEAWEKAGYLKTAEEFRLLYVAMTRAKRLLWMSAAKQAPFTWSKPENLQEQLPCPVIPMLKGKFPRSIVSLSMVSS
ncbi:ATP-dependent helicase [Planktothrix sp. FACHB-1355]|uniref:DNA 3'-5' helicase n=1 Tax=Aerosakkonema funiforme FACHB-1375 TaxID=2949571 RepID=A0A926VF40_9CYAN|nr:MULTISPECIES: ATP-dependent helicase [Oscillatoriales]MBD2182674.1 ATP-dependent helicase [Aerosakkonema funiforme FACHB-1375]MBD3559769.1 ATP-dependent helicase [Planktothrix sp. FACHB-1355]